MPKIRNWPLVRKSEDPRIKVGFAVKGAVGLRVFHKQAFQSLHVQVLDLPAAAGRDCALRSAVLELQR